MPPPEVLAEEFEVLESIYPSELSIISDREIQIDAEPDDAIDGESEPFKLKLSVKYTDDYPDSLPELTLEPINGTIDDSEHDALLAGLLEIGNENLGMAMTFTLVSHLREQLSILVRDRVEIKIAEEREKERIALEVEEARTRGTPVTLESFKAWKLKFDKEMSQKKIKDDDERLRGLTPKEREEIKKAATRLSGRQLFERNRNLDNDDDSLLEEGTVSVDFSQYERTQADDDDAEEDRIQFSDSD
ncbi:RWD-domain-containing protein [Hygrophoropsis aurantiaca]|uniref:RWD-domain-containing protein n=1 Tax=Hygrophoropsis aurantiaca TaxID=72124 RepID=A0ACB8AS60_9AGAM|nr:RWD-domain-containing protein [Hygrophoropsis aurantiaca]